MYNADYYVDLLRGVSMKVWRGTCEYTHIRYMPLVFLDEKDIVEIVILTNHGYSIVPFEIQS